MANLVEQYGQKISEILEEDPVKARKRLLFGFRAYGLKLRRWPDKGLPPSKNQIAVDLNRRVVELLVEPEHSALTSLFMPTELLQAAGLSPLCAELYSSYINGTRAERGFVDSAEGEGVPRSFCSYHKILLGSAFSGFLEPPRCIVNCSLLCDANQLSFRTLAETLKVPQFYLDVPPVSDAESLAYVTEQFQALERFLEELLGKPIEKEALQATIARSNRTLENLRKAIPLKREHWLNTDIVSELYEIYASHIGTGSEEALQYSEQLLRDLEAAPTVSEHGGTRLFWVHTIPNWQAPLLECFNLSEKAQILSCDLNVDSLFPMDPEKPYESMARRLLDSSFNGPGTRRIERTLEMVRALDADGVVIFCHWGCKQTMGISQLMKEALEAEGIPVLILNGDGCDSNNASDGQMSTRLDAYMEMLRA